MTKEKNTYFLKLVSSKWLYHSNWKYNEFETRLLFTQSNNDVWRTSNIKEKATYRWAQKMQRLRWVKFSFFNGKQEAKCLLSSLEWYDIYTKQINFWCWICGTLDARINVGTCINLKKKFNFNSKDFTKRFQLLEIHTSLPLRQLICSMLQHSRHASTTKMRMQFSISFNSFGFDFWFCFCLPTLSVLYCKRSKIKFWVLF